MVVAQRRRESEPIVATCRARMDSSGE
jgi:hypothetical protein